MLHNDLIFDLTNSYILLSSSFRLAQQSIKALPLEVVEKVTVKNALWSKEEEQLLADISQVITIKLINNFLIV